MRNASIVNNSTYTSGLAHQTSRVFSFDHDTNVEVVLINGTPWFVAADACKSLNLPNVTNAISPLDDDEKLPLKILRAGQQRTVNLISESGLYALIVRSTKPNARKFRKWVTNEVLPAIRKTGQYVAGSNQDGYIIQLIEKELEKMNDRLGTYLPKLRAKNPGIGI